MTKYLIGGLRLRTYHATRSEWRALADELESIGEKRLAHAIRAGVAKKEYWFKDDPISLRFRDGSVATLDRFAV